MAPSVRRPSGPSRHGESAAAAVGLIADSTMPPGPGVPIARSRRVRRSSPSSSRRRSWRRARPAPGAVAAAARRSSSSSARSARRPPTTVDAATTSRTPPRPPARRSSRSTRRTPPGPTSGPRSTAPTSSSTSATATATRTRTARHRVHRSRQRLGPEPRRRTNGDGDNGRQTMVYCGEKALLGTLASVGRGGPAPVLRRRTDHPGRRLHDGLLATPTTPPAPASATSRAIPHDAEPGSQRVTNYSTPVSATGAGGTSPPPTASRDEIVDRLLRNPDSTYRPDLRDGHRLSAADLDARAIPTSPAAEVWIQRTDHRRVPLRRPRLLVRLRRQPVDTPRARPPRTVRRSRCSFSDIVGSFERPTSSGWPRQGSRPAAAAASSARSAGDPRARWPASWRARSTCPPARMTTSATTTASATRPTSTRSPTPASPAAAPMAEFCPTRPVTREQMASFLARALASR